MSEASISRLFKHSAIYGIGDVLNRAGALLLLPLYTRQLSPEEYGTLELFYSSSNILRMFLAAGLAHATLRFYFEFDPKDERQAVVSTSIISSIVVSGVILLGMVPFTDWLSTLIFDAEVYRNCFYVTYATIFISISQEIAFAYIRAREYSVFFIIVSFGELVLKIILTAYFVLHMQMGIFGVLLGNLVSMTVAWFAVLGVTVKECGLSFRLERLREMFVYSFPLVIVSLWGMLIANADRFILQRYSSLTAVGLYALAMRFGSVINFAFTMPFTKGYGPYRFSIMKRDDAPQFYSRIMTYFVTGILFVGLGIILFSGDVVRVMASPKYQEAAFVIPLLVISHIFSGLYYLVQTGIYMQKKTGYLTFVYCIAAILNITANLVLIPEYGLMGAGVVLVGTRVLIVIMTHRRSQKLFPVKYQGFRIIKVVALSFLIYGVSLMAVKSPPLESVFIKSVLLCAYPFILWKSSFLLDHEKSSIRNIGTQIMLRLGFASKAGL